MKSQIAIARDALLALAVPCALIVAGFASAHAQENTTADPAAFTTAIAVPEPTPVTVIGGELSSPVPEPSPAAVFPNALVLGEPLAAVPVPTQAPPVLPLLLDPAGAMQVQITERSLGSANRFYLIVGKAGELDIAVVNESDQDVSTGGSAILQIDLPAGLSYSGGYAYGGSGWNNPSDVQGTVTFTTNNNSLPARSRDSLKVKLKVGAETPPWVTIRSRLWVSVPNAQTMILAGTFTQQLEVLQPYQVLNPGRVRLRAETFKCVLGLGGNAAFASEDSLGFESDYIEVEVDRNGLIRGSSSGWKLQSFYRALSATSPETVASREIMHVSSSSGLNGKINLTKPFTLPREDSNDGVNLTWDFLWSDLMLAWISAPDAPPDFWYGDFFSYYHRGAATLGGIQLFDSLTGGVVKLDDGFREVFLTGGRFQLELIDYSVIYGMEDFFADSGKLACSFTLDRPIVIIYPASVAGEVVHGDLPS